MQGFEPFVYSKKNRKLLRKRYNISSKIRKRLPKWTTIRREAKAQRPLIVSSCALDGQGGQLYEGLGKVGEHALTVIGTNTAHGRERLLTMNWGQWRSIDDWNFRHSAKGARWSGARRLRSVRGSRRGVWWKFKNR